MPELVSTLMPLIAIAAIFYLLIVRPQQRRARAARELRSALAPGDRVMLTSGIYGVVRTIDDNSRATVEIAPGTVVEIEVAAVASVAAEDAHDSASTDPDVVDPDDSSATEPHPRGDY